MYAMLENLYGLVLLLIFKLLKHYEKMFWIAVVSHSIIKIGHSMYKIFKKRTLLLQFINSLVVVGELFRYVLYLVIIIWNTEDSVTKIKEDKIYGTWMIQLLTGELIFHFIGFFLTLILDLKKWI